MAASGKLSFTKTKASGTESAQSKITKTEDELQKQIQTQEQISKETGITTTLDVETQQTVKDLIAQISAGAVSVDDTSLAELTEAILTRSKTAQADVTGQISSITEDARLQGEQELQQLQTQLAQQSGGSLANTLVASATGVGRANLESQIARTRGELNLQARQIVTDELSSALTGISQVQAQAERTPIENITNLLNVLKGSTTTQEQTGTQETTSESELSRLLTSLTESVSSGQFATKGQKIKGSISGGNP